MLPPFDIFKLDDQGAVLWHGAASTLDEAKTRVQILGKDDRGEYIILSQQTGNRISIKSNLASTP